MSSIPSTLAAFFVFNPTLGEESTEGNKLLYFYPLLDLDVQKDYVGMTEGIANFTRLFASEPCRAIHTEKQRHAFFQAEKDFWLVLAVNNPQTTTPDGDTIYHQDHLDDDVLQAIVRRCYSLFRLFNGTFAQVLTQNGNDLNALRWKIQLFMRFFIPTVSFHKLPFFTDINGFQFLPVDKPTFLMIQYLVNLVKKRFKVIKTAAVMFNGKLIWSGVDQATMFLLYTLEQFSKHPFYTYLRLNQATPVPAPDSVVGHDGKPGDECLFYSKLARDSMIEDDKYNAQFEAKGGSAARSIPSGWLSGPMYGAQQRGELRKEVKEVTCLNAPKIYMPSSPSSPTTSITSTTSERFLIYRRHHVLFFFIVDDEEELNNNTTTTSDPALDKDGNPVAFPALALYPALEQFVSNNAKRLSIMLNDQSARTSGQEEVFRFLYFNHMNLALKSSLNPRTSPLTMETIQLLRQMHSDFQVSSDKTIRLSRTEYKHRLDPPSASSSSSSTDNNSDTNGEAAADDILARAATVLNQASHQDNDNNIDTRNGNQRRGNTADGKLASNDDSSNDNDNDNNVSDEKVDKVQGSESTDRQEPAATSASAQSGKRVSADVPGGTILLTNSDASKKEALSEICVRTSNSGWLVGRKATQSHREFYVLLDDKLTNLADIQEEVDKLARTYFYNIFIH